jgi:hypothetical protein
MLAETLSQCPYCGERIEVQVDCSAGSHGYIEDCPVCCRPIEFHAEVDLQGGLLMLHAGRDDD